jgi:GTP-binding protein
MSRHTKIAIVGRPNVGKSALFNCLVKKQKAIVDEREGITRDRIYGQTDCFGRSLEIIDTGGMLAQEDPLALDITRHAQIAIEEADALIFVVDYKTGPLALDFEVAKILRRAKKPIVLAVNKVDFLDEERCNLAPFSALGIQPIVPISCSFRWQLAELLEPLLEKIPVEDPITAAEESCISVALVGRTNVGKSTLLNQIVQEERSLVSPLAGTTRDSIDMLFSFNDQQFRFIDTAGIRRKHKEIDIIEKFSRIRTDRSIEEASVCLLLIDCMEGVTGEEKKIAKEIEDSGKACILLLNKWDLSQGFRMEHALKSIELEIPFLAICPKLIISAKTGRNVPQLFPLIQQVYHSYSQRISTHKLNTALIRWLQAYHPPMVGSKRLRIYYIAQVSTNPPKFVLFVNSPEHLSPTYRKYLVNQMRETFAFEGVPIILMLRGKEHNKSGKKKTPSHQHLPSDRDRDLAFIRAKIEEEADAEEEQ